MRKKKEPRKHLVYGDSTGKLSVPTRDKNKPRTHQCECAILLRL